MLWAYQRKGYGLGNFITMTPAIRILAKQTGSAFPVYFESDYVKECYLASPLIKILESKPDNSPINPNSLPSRESDIESDYVAWLRILANTNSEPKPFIDFEQLRIYMENYVAIIHGCLPGNKFKIAKDLGRHWRIDQIDWIQKSNRIPLILGSFTDWEDFWQDVPIPDIGRCLLGQPIRIQLAVLSYCGSFVSNDTGLYHAAAAMGLPGKVYWKDTDMYKNMCPNLDVEHLQL